ncbi:hypothetical protein FRB90_011769 [Tulasnella sp. 427]|nr:hypothetical protein FRB90_011769 [Tulasnella sp. 427]
MKKPTSTVQLRWVAPTLGGPARSSSEGSARLAERSSSSKIYYQHLDWSPAQRASVQTLEAASKTLSFQFDMHDQRSQNDAQNLVTHHGLTPAMIADLESRCTMFLRETRPVSIVNLRQFKEGINTSKAPEINIDEWMDPTSPAYKPVLRRAVFHYKPRTAVEERFKACIASKEMEEATWRYEHRSQVILDGTFGVCDRRVLLFVVMAVDEENRGVPLVFILFSAPTGNQQSSSGYNTAILQELLGRWKSWLERGGQAFMPFVAITDTDTKERAALVIVFPGIILLLCKFHLRQCWTNRKRALGLGRSTVPGDFDLCRIQARLQNLEETGQELAVRDLLHSFKYEDNGTRLTAECFSSTSLMSEAERSSHRLVLQIDGFASCTCTDFQERSFAVGACKHILALFNVIKGARIRDVSNPIPQFWLPQTSQAALAIRLAQPIPSSALTEDKDQHVPHPEANSTDPNQNWLVNPANALSDLLDATDTDLVIEEDGEDNPSANDVHPSEEEVLLVDYKYC